MGRNGRLRVWRRFGPSAGFVRSSLTIALVGVLVAAGVAAVLVFVLLPRIYPGFPVLGQPPSPSPQSLPIDHIVIVPMENRAFDDYFGVYCRTSGPFCPHTALGIPPGTCIPHNPTNPGLGCAAPYNETPDRNGSLSEPDIPHAWAASHIAWNGGKMDGFYYAELNSSETLGHLNGSTIPAYWDWAEQYALGDNFFSSTLSYSLPNHWFLMAGQAPPAAIYYQLELHPFSGGSTAVRLTAPQVSYLDDANNTTTIADLLLRSPVTWKYYDYPLRPTYRAAISSSGYTDAFNYWNPLGAKAESYGAGFFRHFVAWTDFLNDTRAGALPQVSWVVPPYADSDHPPEDVRSGEAWVSGLLNAVERSSEWNSTAVFVTWDDYGGFYDHVAPPNMDQWGLSFRVPLLVVSPYTPEGDIVSSFGYFESLLHFVEWRFGLSSLTHRDANAPLPLDYFDFSARPRPPLVAPITNASVYPRAFQTLLAPAAPAGLAVAAPRPGTVTLSWHEAPGTGPVAGYLLRYGPAASAGGQREILDAGTDRVTLSNLQPLVPYRFSLVALDGGRASVAAVRFATPGVAGFASLETAPLGLFLVLGLAGGPVGVGSVALPSRRRTP